MAELENHVKAVLNYCDSGDLMTALSYFEANVRPIVENLESYENTELLTILKDQCNLIDNEEWHSALVNIDKLSEMLNA
jgi:hypothetical protein